ncbi:hypothetical protein E0H75_01960 [Kribbella capetownensis]|uniref:SRPBCC family protein n=1 Tax=Kribbella capetownensis TaxID=1572659 RepID=A0A4R0JY96_9ACTN|nr:hypothetical protein [Kribbella capetownensis]TCC52553.1 hypothetical protein E0H75_01960 [Kribbella capetownensis]
MEQATLSIPADRDTIRAVLLDVLALPEWNEAFVSLSGPAVPTVGTPYTLQVRPGLSGRLEYAAIEPDRIEIHWQVPGFRESGIWTIADSGQVTHTFTQSGPLAAVLKPAYRGIAHVRLNRLATRVQRLLTRKAGRA